MGKSREQFQKWWEEFYETSPRESWALIYSSEHDYYVDSDIDGQYDAWKASREALNGCPKCGGTGMADSGGVQPWGEPIEIECDCQFEERDNDTN